MQLRKAFAMASCLTVSALVMASCAPTASPAPTAKPTAASPAKAPEAPTAAAPAKPAATPRPAAEQPRQGGTLSIGFFADVASFDLHQESAGATLLVIAPAFSGLLQYSPVEVDKILGDLAETWEMSPDGKAYTFRLRRGVTWHDGAPLTSEDVQFSLDRIRKPPSGTRSPRSSMLKAISRIETPDKDTVRLELTGPSAGFIPNIATAWTKILPKHVVQKQGHLKNLIVGTGAFKLKDYATGVSYEFARNRDYFVKERPYLDGLVFYVIPDVATRFAAFRTHRVNMTGQVNGLTPAQAELVQKTTPDASVGQSRGANWWAFFMNNSKAPWNDVRVRRAASLAIDRQQAIKIVDQGTGEVGLFLPSGQWAVPEASVLKLPGFGQPKDADRAEAKKLLAEAGYPEGFKTTIMVRAGTYYETGAVLMRDQLATIGIQATVDVLEHVAMQDRMRRLDYASAYYKLAVDVRDPTAIFRDTAMTGGGRNYGGFSDKLVDEMIEKQDTTLDAAKRKEIVTQIQERMLELQAAAITHWGSYVSGWWKEVRGFNAEVPPYNNSHYYHVWLAR